MHFTAHYDSPIGKLTLRSDGENLLGLWVDGQVHFGGRYSENAIEDETLPLFAQVREWLDGYFRGEQPSPEALPLSPAGTPFQMQVWQLLRDIPYGITVTYGDLARQLGKPQACQAVGSAVGRNPISIIIPCHRVLGARGDLTAFAGGLERKEWLLNHENASINHRPRG